MKQFIKRYLNEIVGLAVLVMMVIAFVDGQLVSERVQTETPTVTATVSVDPIR
ncbi:MAG: hypothetical protein AAF660_01730 [Pseudomonadota bacterium]